MHGDFTLDPFHYRDDVTRVLVQQGRVQLDSDFNEQTETQLRFLRGLGRDLIGPHGGVDRSFLITPLSGKPGQLQIERGEYYVDGIRCVLPFRDLWEAPGDQSRTGPVPLTGPIFIPPENDSNNGPLLLYLDVYERHLSSAQDDTLREVALGGADTASRAVLTWQVRTIEIDDDLRKLAGDAAKFGWPWRDVDAWYVALNIRLRTGLRMRAQAAGSASSNPCIISPDARYRGSENRLFRVEIHDAGADFGPGIGEAAPRPATFKWSQDNGSIVYPIRDVNGKTLHLASLGRDARSEICVNDWVEVVDDDLAANPRFQPLLQVVSVDHAGLKVELSAPPQGDTGTKPEKHPILRRWASDLVGLQLRGTSGNAWIDLADGVQVEFSLLDSPATDFRPGDYWLIPTRTAEGTVVWPQSSGVPRDLPPNGIDHHYAPLGEWKERLGTAATVEDRRLKFQHLGK